MLFLGSKCLCEELRQLVLPRKLSELAKQLPTSVVRELGCQHGTERLSEGRPRIRNNLQQAAGSCSGDVRTGSLRWWVTAKLFHALAQHLKVLQLLHPHALDHVECGFAPFA